MKINEKYGLTNNQIKFAMNKLKFNKEFMHSNGVQVDNKIVPFADFVQNSYMNSDRYVAELQHRAWSVYNYATDRGLSNIFLTLTLPSKWHNKKTFRGKLVKNKKFAGRKYICTIKKIKFINAHVIQNIPFIEPILDFSETIDKYTPRGASKELSRLLKKFFDDRSYKSIVKDDRCYFRVTEPHKDGTPHVHMSLFVPVDKRERIVKALNRLFPAPQSKIELEVNNPVAYLMKYVLKTLDDLRDEDSEISNLTLWYLYHGISRFYTSRTFISLEVYRRLNGMYTLRNLTEKYILNEVSVYFYSGTKKIAMIENEFGTIYVPKPVNWSQDFDEKDRLSEDGNTVQLDSGFESVYKDKEFVPIPFIIDGQEFYTYKSYLLDFNRENEKLIDLGIEPLSFTSILKVHKSAAYQMNDFDLYQYFRTLDIETENEQHYIYTHNLLVERGYLDEELLSMTAFQDITKEFEIND